MPIQSFPHDQTLTSVSLNNLRAFESAARHLSFTSAAKELGVTQGAVSHQVKALEDRLGIKLFRRTPRGLTITDEGLTLFPTLNDVFTRMARLFDRFDHGERREVLTISVVGTFALGWLLPRLPRFEQAHPFVDLRLLTNNNMVDLAAESLDCAIRFGDGAWRSLESTHLLRVSLTPLCAPTLVDRFRTPDDIRGATLLRSYRGQDWFAWLSAAGLDDFPLRGPIFDSSSLMAQAAMRGHGIAVLPLEMFEFEVGSGCLIQPYPLTASTGSYWLVHRHGAELTDAYLAFRNWLSAEMSAGQA